MPFKIYPNFESVLKGFKIIIKFYFTEEKRQSIDLLDIYKIYKSVIIKMKKLKNSFSQVISARCMINYRI